MDDLDSFLKLSDLCQIGGTGNPERQKIREVTLAMSPNVIFETGIFAGTSTVIFLECLKMLNKGTLYSVDTMQSLGKWTGCFVTNDLKDRWFPIYMKSPDFFNVFPDKLKIDIFMHDSEHSYEVMKAEFNWALSHINSPGWIFAHDTHQNTAWEEFYNFLTKSCDYKDIIDSFKIGSFCGVQLKDRRK